MRFSEWIVIIVFCFCIAWAVVITFLYFSSPSDSGLPPKPDLYPVVVEPEPEPEPEKFEWHLQRDSLLNQKDQYTEAMLTLKHIDEQIQALNDRERILGFKSSHTERSRYLEVRVHLLYHINSLSQFIVEDDYDETEQTTEH